MKPGFKIITIHAFIAEDKDGTEGIIGEVMPSGQWMPFICADEERLNHYAL